MLLLVLLCPSYTATLFTTPVASNNIYEQHYQMHRFATKYYNKPLAVNDLGYVSYQNDNYILDLWGLASIHALKLRTNGDTNWMATITEEKNIKFAMIYNDLFKEVPDSWQKIGELQLGKIKIAPFRDSVSFYAVDCESYNYTYHLTEVFSKTLPEGVVFRFNDKKAPGNCINTDG